MHHLSFKIGSSSSRKLAKFSSRSSLPEYVSLMLALNVSVILIFTLITFKRVLEPSNGYYSLSSSQLKFQNAVSNSQQLESLGIASLLYQAMK